MRDPGPRRNNKHIFLLPFDSGLARGRTNPRLPFALSHHVDKRDCLACESNAVALDDALGLCADGFRKGTAVAEIMVNCSGRVLSI
jgi:hypothetical protein